MTTRRRSPYWWAAGLVTAAAILVYIAAGCTTPEPHDPCAWTQEPFDTASTATAQGIISTGEARYSGEDSHGLSMTHDAETGELQNKDESIYIDGDYYLRVSSPEDPDVFLPWKKVEEEVLKDEHPCIDLPVPGDPGPHYVDNRSTRRYEIWVDAGGRPVRALVAVKDVVTYEVIFSGFGEPNIIEAPPIGENDWFIPEPFPTPVPMPLDIPTPIFLPSPIPRS